MASPGVRARTRRARTPGVPSTSVACPACPRGMPVAALHEGRQVQEDIGQKLLEAHLIDASALTKAQQQQKNTGGTLTANLVKIGAVSEEALLEFLSRLYGVPSIDLRG